MPFQPDIPDQPTLNYNFSDHPKETTDSRSDELRVIAPPEPPAFGPVGARALLRLLVAVHGKRSGADHHIVEET
ncbi:hypothetical protein [Micromonospora sp. NPDC126480]|uniref:hypothetical protein n=1 Tax=Micromonospora sp. NPDC126480 TaxID=3155312 RepID=UPI00332EA468